MSRSETDDDSLDCDNIPLFKEDDNEEEEDEEQQSNATTTSNDGISETTAQKFAQLQERRLELVTKRCSVQKRKRSRHHHRNRSLLTNQIEEKTDKEKDKDNEEWITVRSYLDVNRHLHGPVGHGVRQAKCRLEEKINEAIAEGEMEVAEQLSDKLATREFGVRAANAFAAKRFDRDKQEKKKKMLTNAKKKLHWGFETKQRWEMKGNM